MKNAAIKIGVVGLGAIGSVVAAALIKGMAGYEWVGACEVNEEAAARKIGLGADKIRFLSQDELIAQCDWIVEALPALAARDLAMKVLGADKTLVAISSAALLTYSEILETAQKSGRILIPSGAIAGIDAISALSLQGLTSLELHTTKPPQSFGNAPYIVQNQIDVEAITSPQVIFEGSARQAAAGFPANVNVAATLALASRMNADDIRVKITADPTTVYNTHHITVDGGYSRLSFRIENKPDPQNPKSSALTALSILSLLRRQTASVAI